MSLEHNAQAWLAIRLGDEPLVPADARQRGSRQVIAAALERLEALRGRAGRVAVQQRRQESDYDDGSQHPL